MEYQFTLQFKLDPRDANHKDLVERLGEAGCTDALAGLGVAGHLGLQFDREAISSDEAIQSAIAQVKKALPGAVLIEVTPDLVGLTEVADMVGFSRQNMRKLMLTHSESFPAPMHIGSAALWHLALILDFLSVRQYPVPHPLVEVAQTAMRVNITKETTLVDQRGHDTGRHALAS